MKATFQAHNRSRATHRLFQLVLWLGLIAAINLIGLRQFARWDLGERYQLALSPESAAYVRTLEVPVEVIVALPEASDDPEVRRLSRAMRDLTRALTAEAQASGLTLRVEYVDLLRDLDRANALAREVGLEQPIAVVVRAEDRFRILLPTDLLVFENQQAVGFNGETAILQAMLEVAGDEAPVIYFVTGHGEMALNDPDPARGLSVLAEELRRRNIIARPLPLSEVETVPADAAAVVVADPQGPLLEEEVARLQLYLDEGAGDVLLFLGPTRAHGLDALLEGWGLRADDMVVLEEGDAYRASSGSVLVRRLGEHPLMQPLIANQTFLVGSLSRPVRPDLGAPLDEQRRITLLFASSGQSYAESNYRRPEAMGFDEALDLAGPVPLAATVTREARSPLGLATPSGQLTVIGMPDLWTNQRLVHLGNSALLRSWLHLTLDRSFALPTRGQPFEQISLSLSKTDVRRLGLSFVAVPSAVLLLGLSLLLWRRYAR